MKIDRFFSRFFLVAAVCLFCACSSDDDEDDGSGSGGSGKGSVTLNIGGVKAKLDNVYWMAEANGDGTNYYELQFMSFDMYAYMAGGDYSSFPSSYSVVYISFEAPGTLSELPVGTFSEEDYELSGILDASMENGGEGRYYVEEGPSSGNLVITKTGDTYTVTIDPLEIIYSDPDNVGNGDWGSTTMQWNYAGKIKKGSHGVEWRKQARRQHAGIKPACIPAEVIYLPR
jgi:hypothetical protein